MKTTILDKIRGRKKYRIFKYFFRLIYLINTPSLGDANLTVKELKDGLTNGNGEMIMKRMSAY